MSTGRYKIDCEYGCKREYERECKYEFVGAGCMALS